MENSRRRIKGAASGEAGCGGLRENAKTMIEALVLVFFLNAFLLQSFAIPTASMEDNMLIGDHLFANRAAYDVAGQPLDRLVFPMKRIGRGDIVVFKAPPEIKAGNLSRLMYVKRVIGLAGDLVRISGNRVFINGKPLDEPYVFLKGLPSVPADFPPSGRSDWEEGFPEDYKACVVPTADGPAFRVPDGHYFCMGDNRNISADSRVWGPLPAANVIGRPWRIYWSIAADSGAGSRRGPLGRLVDTVLRFPARTRWNRLLKKY
jgi:signal peptidase I